MRHQCSEGECIHLIAKGLSISKESVEEAYADAQNVKVGTDNISAKVFPVQDGRAGLVYFAIADTPDGKGKEVWQGETPTSLIRW